MLALTFRYPAKLSTRPGPIISGGQVDRHVHFTAVFREPARSCAQPRADFRTPRNRARPARSASTGQVVGPDQLVVFPRVQTSPKSAAIRGPDCCVHEGHSSIPWRGAVRRSSPRRIAPAILSITWTNLFVQIVRDPIDVGAPASKDEASDDAMG